MDTGTAMLHFACNPDDRTFAIGDSGSAEQLHQLWHQALPEHRPGLEQRSQIFDELTGVRIANDRHSYSPRDRSVRLDAEFREYGFASDDDFADFDYGLLPMRPG